jgi:hypothetical protein
MKTKLPLLLIALTAACVTVQADTLVHWRLDQTESPILASEGFPNLKWWVEKDGAYVSAPEAAPAALYRDASAVPQNSFDAGQSYGDGVRGLVTDAEAEFYNVSQGLTVEGFFRTQRSKPDLERQAVVACGEGMADVAWVVRLLNGKPGFGVFQGASPDPVAMVELEDDVRDDRWYYFAARVVPGDPGKLTLTIRADGEAAQTAEMPLPSGFSIRQNRKPLIIGRSSLYIDNKPEYRGTWDTFAGIISDVRISSGALSDDALLGKVAD